MKSSQTAAGLFEYATEKLGEPAPPPVYVRIFRPETVNETRGTV